MTIGSDESFVDVDYTEAVFTDGEPDPADNTIEICMAEIVALDGTIEDGKKAAVIWLEIIDPESGNFGMCGYSV